MFRVHCFTESNYKKFGLEFPENTYEIKNMDKVATTIKNVLATNKSGISKVVIEKDNFSVNAQSPINVE